MEYYGKKYEIIINAQSKVSFNQGNMSEHGEKQRILVLNVINNVLKSALRGMDNLR